MHVLQLLNLFLLAPQIEIVETTLPEPTGEFAANGQPPGDAQLYGLNYRGARDCPVAACVDSSSR